MPTFHQLLRRLALLYGVETSYRDVTGTLRLAPPESLLSVLRALGAPIDGAVDVADAIRSRTRTCWSRRVDPVIVAWDGLLPQLKVRLPASADGTLSLNVRLETGEASSFHYRLADVPVLRGKDVDGERFLVKRLPLQGQFPSGYHKLSLEFADGLSDCAIISAPVHAFDREGARDWGLFLPMYALHDIRSWGAGDLSSLDALLDWGVDLGARAFGTLPLLAAFLDEPFEPSPYAPASRLFWNELYVDITSVPELPACGEAQQRLASGEVASEVEALRGAPLVDYRRQAALKRRVLEALARSFFLRPSTDRREAFESFLRGNPRVEDYAEFRAAVERHRGPWPDWPSPQREGRLSPGDYDEEGRRYHLYVQWLMDEQLGRLAGKAEKSGSSLYLDLPLGAHYNSYDVWRWRDCFALDASGGAPPDAFFTWGQDWGFPPLHPEAIRENGHAYFIACIRHHLRKARMLRIDHVMGLHRLFWIPKGLGAGNGVYVRYPADELYAVLCLESHRHQAEIVGENLGTVPPYVNPKLRRHRFYGLYVGQYQLTGPEAGLSVVPADYVAGMNTHDMPPFAAFVRGLDIGDRRELGLLPEARVPREEEGRRSLVERLGKALASEGWLESGSEDSFALLQAALCFLAAGPARLLLVNLEDLWLETLQQNVPGTWRERPNWRRRARYPLEVFRQMPEVVETLRRIDYLRHMGRGG